MAEINSIGSYENQLPIKNNIINKNKESNKQNKDNIKKKKDKVLIKSKNNNKQNNSINKSYNIKDGVKRPIKIDNSNNIFFVNYKGENETIKIKPGQYNLTEISLSIQEKINESFGIGKVNLKMTGSLSDGFIHAEEDKTNKFLIEE
ncbi:MAG TPA: hypothetical protein VKN64_11145 [Halanaerobiales bacterium]|nr:hypothetical protein [Halanaerobiales bacterium]